MVFAVRRNPAAVVVKPQGALSDDIVVCLSVCLSPSNYIGFSLRLE